MEPNSQQRPLEGVRILDLTAVWAGPYATRLLGDMGAEVIKVEGPKSPDLLRALSMLPAGTENAHNKAAYFNHNNRNKKSLVLDLATPRGREIALQLAAISDVVIENFRSEVLENLGLGYEALKQVREDIILVSMPGHGKSGPEKDFVGFGTNIEQVSGLASLSGYVDGPPQKSGISYGDPVAGISAAAAVVMALLARKRTGRGRYIEVAQRENLSALIGEHLLAFQKTGEQPARMGNRHRAYAPHGAYPTAGEDRWVTIACRDDREFAGLCRAMGREDLLVNPGTADAASRHRHQDQLDATITEWTSARDRDDILRDLVQYGVPAAPVLTVDDLVNDPHLRARGFFESVTHEQAGRWEMDRPLYRFAARPTSIQLNAPIYGEHNGYVLGELLGLSDAEIGELTASGIVASEPDMSAHR